MADELNLNPSSQRVRWQFLDLAKGIAAILMILGHAQIFFDPNCYFPPPPVTWYQPINHHTQFWIYIIQSSVDAFYFSAGVAMGRKLALAKSPSIGLPALAMVKRGVFLLVIDLVIISWCYLGIGAPFQPTFGSISCFGLAFAMMPLVRWMNARTLFFLGVSIFVCREVLILPYPFEEHIYEIFYGIFWSPVRAESWNSLFVVLCWFPIILWGVAYGKSLVNNRAFGTPTTLLRATAVCAFLFLIFRLTTPFGSLGQRVPNDALQVFQLSKYPASMHFHLLNMTFCFGYLYLGSVWEKSNICSRAREIVALLGRQIFFVYIFHLLFFGIVKHGLGITAADGSLIISILWFILTTAISVISAKKYEAMKLRYKNRFFLFRYI